MLRQLSIRNVVLVERLELEFEPGLGVLTGETGAGKSILLDALGPGARRARRQRAGPRRARSRRRSRREIRAAAGHPALATARRAGRRARAGRAADHSPHRQERRRQPRLRRRPGGPRRRCSASSARSLVEIHGQHDDRGLLNPQGHRALLDASAGSTLAAVEQAWSEVTRIEAELAAGPRRARGGGARPRLARPCRRRDRGARARGGRGDDARRGAGGDAGRRARPANR